MHTHKFSDALFGRIQSHAIPLVDSIEDVIARAFDALEGGFPAKMPTHSPDSSAEQGQVFNPASAPNLTHATLLTLSIGGEERTSGVYWSTVMHDVISAAGKAGISPERLLKLMEVPAKMGVPDHYSYTYIPAAGISVQGQNANRAWRQAYKIAKAIDLPIAVTWIWQNKDKAQMPGVTGIMKLEKAKI